MIWKSVPGWPEYEVSDEGGMRRVLGKKGQRIERAMKPGADQGAGYLVISLWRNNKQSTAYVHRLVAAAFLGPANGLEVNHIDGVKYNNVAENLEYATRTENERHASRLGLLKVGMGRKDTKLTAEHVLAIRSDISTPQRELGRFYGVAQSTISKIQLGYRQLHVGGTIVRRRA